MADYDTINNKINSRVFPSQQLKPLYEVRPVSTKYSLFQVIEERTQPKINDLDYKSYSTEVFNPGYRGPVDFYLNEIDTESKLRNQFMALQKSNQSEYVPELNSSLYVNTLDAKREKFSTTECNSRLPPANLAPNKFYNSTRMNLRN
jgi:hypothetical protein